MGKRIILIILILALVSGLVYAGMEFYQWWTEGRLIEQEAQEIAEDFLIMEETHVEPAKTETETEETEEDSITHDMPAETEEPAKQKRTPLTLDYTKLNETNSEAIGWIRIDGTNVSYPVMQTTDNSKYMNKNIYGEKSSAGTPFLDCTNSLEPMDSNLVIYGHNMGVGRTSAFSTLTKYKKQAQWDNHPIVELNLKGETSTWRIFAVLEYNMEDMQEYNYTTHNFLTAEDKLEFIEEAKLRSSYNTGVEVGEDDYILTLSTCDRSKYGTNGRIIIMAVKE